jgi:anti-sigma regulatory factor (Ser/Thr protein kinase)
MTGTDTERSGADTFEHAALIVDSDEGLRNRLVPAVRRCIELELPVMVVVAAHTERLLRADLGGHGERVRWGQPGAFYQRLGFAFEGFRRLLAAQHANGERLHLFTEPDVATGATGASGASGATDPGWPVDRAAAYLSYEAVRNEVYAPYGCPVTCLWDGRRHPTPIIDDVRSLHNHEVTEAGSVVNAGYVQSADHLAGRNHPLPSPPVAAGLDFSLTGLDDLPLLRTALESWAKRRSFLPAAAGDVVIAVGEVAGNGLVHGAPPVRVRGWLVAGTLVVQVDDAGGRPLPATAGYYPPTMRSANGRGLWLARQLADVVTAYTGAGITSVRLHFPTGLTHRD